jgi:hypothetical protein
MYFLITQKNYTGNRLLVYLSLQWRLSHLKHPITRAPQAKTKIQQPVYWFLVFSVDSLFSFQRALDFREGKGFIDSCA